MTVHPNNAKTWRLKDETGVDHRSVHGRVTYMRGIQLGGQQTFGEPLVQKAEMRETAICLADVNSRVYNLNPMLSVGSRS